MIIVRQRQQLQRSFFEKLLKSRFRIVVLTLAYVKNLPSQPLPVIPPYLQEYVDRKFTLLKTQATQIRLPRKQLLS